MSKNIILTRVAAKDRPLSRLPIPIKHMLHAKLYPHAAMVEDYGINVSADNLPPITPNYDATEIVFPRTGDSVVVLQSRTEILEAIHANDRDLHRSPEVIERLSAQLERLQLRSQASRREPSNLAAD